MKITFKYITLKIFTCFFIFLTLLYLPITIYANDTEMQETSSDDFNQLYHNALLETSSDVNSPMTINARSCIVLDRLSHNIIYGKNEKNRVKMASTTKIMTAIVVLENTSSLDKTINVSKKAANTGGSRLGLKTNDKITIRDLMYGLMLCSGNDAAVCLAESIGGSIPEFANLMNAKAKELGLTNTHFESPHGLDSSEHYTTAYELALIADYALKNTTFLNIVGTKNYTVTINGYPKTISNTNELLGNLNGVYGIKTGFTNGANRCLVTACKRGNMDIICVVLGCDTKNFRTQDSIKLIEYAFKNFEYYNIKEFASQFILNWQKENPDFFTIEKGNSNNIELFIDFSNCETPTIPIQKNLIDDIEASLSLTSYLNAPIHQGDLIGNLDISSKGVPIASFQILSDRTIEKNNILDYMINFFRSYPNQIESTLW